jgi:maleylacetoacetate isomerase
MTHTGYHLYHYWRSSASFRVRIALFWKNIPVSFTHVGLLNGESETPEHLARNPAGYVPVLELKSGAHAGTMLTESLAIIRYLEEVHPESPTLFPGNVIDHAKIWALSETINAGSQPLINLPVLAKYSSDANAQKEWAQHWIRHGLQVFEILASQTPGSFSHGNEFSLADVCLIPHLYAADRFQVSLIDFPRIRAIQKACATIQALTLAHPEHYKPADA